MGIVANVRSRAMASRRGVLITLVSVDNRVDKIVDKWAKSGCVWLYKVCGIGVCAVDK